MQRVLRRRCVAGDVKDKRANDDDVNNYAPSLTPDPPKPNINTSSPLMADVRPSAEDYHLPAKTAKEALTLNCLEKLEATE